MQYRLGWLLAAASGIFGQSASTITLSNGVGLKVAADFGQPTGQEALKVQMTRASGDSFYRIFRDQNGLAVFAYELKVGLSSSGDVVDFTAKPVETEFAAKFPNADGGKPVPTLSEERSLPPLDSGGGTQIGLFELEGLGLKVIDTVSVELDAAATSNEDSLERMRLTGLRLKINDTALHANGPGGTVTGRYALIYLPGQGAYIISVGPVESSGFVKLGSIDGSKIMFTWNNQSVEADAAAPILGGSGSGELWVKFDPTYRPVGNWTKARLPDGASDEDEYFAAASDSLGWWLP